MINARTFVRGLKSYGLWRADRDSLLKHFSFDLSTKLTRTYEKKLATGDRANELYGSL
jgi:hypothetical protein